ncbi:MAG TPA: DNA modification methylase [Tepidisphaeraceae bacterium]|nr:DNA modification methylase [Tepidisphaeraceae bacterium]
MKKLTPHPLSELMPRMRPQEYEALKADLADNGLREDIWLFEGKIIDGRHRDQICHELGIKPRYRDYTGDDPVGFLKSCTLHRNLSDTQKACFAANLIDALKGRWGGNRRERTNTLLNGKSSEIAALWVGVSASYVEKAIRLKHESPRLFERALADYEFTITQAISQMEHQLKHRHVERLRRAAGVSLEDCELRLGDNIEIMRSLPAGSARLVFADPPYNNGWVYRNDPTKDRLPDTEYLQACRAWMSECARLLAGDGSLFVLIDDRYTDHFGILLRDTGLLHRPTIICWETFANYNSNETSLSKNARYLHWYTKSDRPLINVVEPRLPSDRQEKYNDARGREHGRLPSNVWPFVRITSQDKERCPWLGQKGNAPQLPRELPERCIFLASNPGDLVIDPFNGNGVTGIAAILNDRRYIGIDRDSKGLAQARSWIGHQVSRLRHN